MPHEVDVETVGALLALTERRLRTARALQWMASAATLGLWRPSKRPSAAAVLEQAYPEFKNGLITADEWLRTPRPLPSYIEARVFADAAKTARAAQADVVPMRRAAIGASVGVAAWMLVAMILLWGPRFAGARRMAAPSGPATSVAAAWHVSAAIVPPAYAKLPPITLRDPDRLEALEGSTLRVRVDAGAPPLAMRTTGTRGTELAPDRTGVQAATLTLVESGYVLFEEAKPSARQPPRLIGVAVIPDRAPTVHVTAPARDLLVPDAKGRVAIAGQADDDLGLTKLELRYTRVSGSGEQFEFREGTVPLTIARDSGVRWRAAAELPLASLDLQPGDTLIYRLVAADARGAGGQSTSDTYMIDIAGPGQPTLAGFELPPERDRYALSQQMVLLKIQRLHARRATLPAETLRDEALAIAAEQRTVRATFVFMLGGELEDEEEEAAQAHEIEEGRLENAARRDMLEAVRHMIQVEGRLTAVDSGGALPPARAAVAALERAFGRRRYFLRTLPVRGRIDPSRRLTGDAAEARDASRSARAGEEPAAAAATRAAIAELVALAGRRDESSAEASQRLGQAAERVLALDPAATDLQAAALRLARRAAAVASGGPSVAAAEDVRAALEAVLARARRCASRPLVGAPASGALRGRWQAAIEQDGRR